MHAHVLKFLSYQRHIFGICPECGEIFRLSDCKVYEKSNPPADWKEKLDKEEMRLNNFEEKLDEKMDEWREKGREQGRKQADRIVKKIDTVFSPLKLNPDDSKVISHPIDFVVFNGMKSQSNKGVKNIILLDSKDKSTEGKAIQKSLVNAVEKENYEWLTLRVENNGKIIKE